MSGKSMRRKPRWAISRMPALPLKTPCIRTVRARSGDSLAAPMPGQVVGLLVAEGQTMIGGETVIAELAA